VIYILTGENTLKVKNIKKNNKIAVTIPFWKNFFHKNIPTPPAEMHFRAKAEIILYENEEARIVIKKSRMNKVLRLSRKAYGSKSSHLPKLLLMALVLSC
jgi:hypothetical protein